MKRAVALRSAAEQPSSAPAARQISCNVVTPHDAGISLDTVVDWLTDAGHTIHRVDDHGTWLTHFENALRALPETQRRHSVLPLLPAFRQPEEPVGGSLVPAQRFEKAVRDTGIGDGDVPHLTAELIAKYATDLRHLHLL